MAVNEPKHCEHPACKCVITELDASCCGSFCEEVEQSEDLANCGCGHVMCDVSKELGNVSTFAPGQ
jgi:hypothetical protein